MSRHPWCLVVEAEDADKQQMRYRAPRSKDHPGPLSVVMRLGSAVTLQSLGTGSGYLPHEPTTNICSLLFQNFSAFCNYVVVSHYFKKNLLLGIWVNYSKL